MAARDEVIRLIMETAGEESVEALADALKKLEDEAAGGGNAAQKLAAELDKLATATKAAGEFVALKAAVTETEEALNSARLELAVLNTTYSETERQTKGVAAEFAKAEKTISGLEGELNQQNLALQRMGGALAKAGVDVNTLVKEEQRLRDEAVKAVGALDSHQAAAKYAAEASAKNAAALKAMGDAYANARDKVTGIAEKLTAAGVAAAAAAAAFAAYKTGEFFAGAIKGAAEFEAQIGEIAAVSGASASELDLLRSSAEKAALDTGIGFSDVNATLAELAKSVGDANTAVATLKPTLDLATASGTETAQSAQILTTALTQFGLEASNATNVADLLVKGANATSASVEGLGNALSYAAPIARQLGMSVDETVVAISALAKEGFNGSRAGTALRNVLSALADPSSKFSEELDRLGIHTRNFNEVISELAKRGEAGKRALLTLDSEARPAIVALVNSGDGIAKMVQTFQQLNVTAATAAQQMRDNLSGATDKARVAFEYLRKELVEPLLQPLTAELSELAVKMREFAASPEFERIRTALGTAFQAGIDGVKEFIGSVDLTEVAGRIESFATGAGEALRNFSGSVGEYIGYAKEVINGFGIALDAVQTGVFAIAAAITKLGSVTADFAAVYTDLARLVPTTSLLAKTIGVDLVGAAEEFRLKAGALDAVYQEFATRTAGNFAELQGGIERVGGAMEQAALDAAPAADRIAAGMEGATQSVVTLNDELEFVVPKAQAAGEAGKQAGEEIAVGMMSASGKIITFGQAMDSIKGRSFKDLADSAADAATKLDWISAAVKVGKSNIYDAKVAFQDYARAQLALANASDAAGKAQIESSIRTKAASLGLTDELKKLGLAIDDVGFKAQKNSQHFDRLRGSIEDVGDAAGASSNSIAGFADKNTYSLGEMSKAAAEAYEAAFQLFTIGSTTGSATRIREINRITEEVTRQKEAYESQLQTLEKVAAGQTELWASVQFGASEYAYLTHEQNMALLVARKRAEEAVEANRKEAESINATSTALEQKIALLEKQIQQAQTDAAATVTRRLDVNLTVKNEQIGGSPLTLSPAQLEDLSRKVLERIRRDMP